MNINDYINKYAAITYNEHQTRVADKLQKQRGVLVYHGLGSGKTLTSILSAEGQGGATVVVPASLQGNYKKELDKAEAVGDYDISSYEMFAKRTDPPNKMVILDEAHRIRNSDTKRSRKVRESTRDSDKILLLTGTPIQNKPHELAPLINTLTGENTLPLSPGEFERAYIKKIKTEPGLWDKLFKGGKTSTTKAIKNKKDLISKIKGLTDYHPSSTEDFPAKEEHTVKVPFTKEQLNTYKMLERDAGASLKYFIQNKLPADKKEAKNLNAFAGAVRQVANTEAAYSTADTGTSPKIQAIADRIRGANGPVLVYSNYLKSGVFPMQKKLDEDGVSNAVYTGQLNKKEKDAIITSYNNGDIDALLVSSSGGEGLDLKGTRQVHIMEPHWNDPKLEQVIGRAARYKSHEGLPEDQKKVDIFKYTSVLPNKKGVWDTISGGKGKAHVGIDQYLYTMSTIKKNLNEQFLDVLKNN